MTDTARPQLITNIAQDVTTQMASHELPLFRARLDWLDQPIN